MRMTALLTSSISLASLTGCSNDPPVPGQTVDSAASPEALAPGVVGVDARSAADSHTFELTRDSVPSGWTTFRFRNASHVDHFALVTRIPDGKTLRDYRDELAKVAQNGVDHFVYERELTYPDAGTEFPNWYPSDVQVMGGPGLTAPGHTSSMTVNLDPGTYILECYIKTPDGRFHAGLGMLAELTVTAEASDVAPPQSTLELTLRNPESGGIEAASEVPAGLHTIAVHFAEQQSYTNLGQNDVHVVRLEDDTDVAQLAAWMDAGTAAGFVSPGAPATFLGGAEEMPVNTTGYFQVQLTPGRYAWISEIPDPAGRGMLQQFTVLHSP